MLQLWQMENETESTAKTVLEFHPYYPQFWLIFNEKFWMQKIYLFEACYLNSGSAYLTPVKRSVKLYDTRNSRYSTATVGNYPSGRAPNEYHLYV